MKIRIKFKKYGSMVYLGHLDVLRYFQKSVLRAGIDIAYSEGFSPHQIMSFAAPLGVGIISEGEYCDIVVNKFTNSEQMKEDLNSVMVEGFEIVSVVELKDGTKNAMATVANADYQIEMKDSYLQETDISRFDDFCNQENINIFKKTKRSAKVVDIKPMISSISLNNNKVFMSLKTGSVANLKPELVMDAFWQYCNGIIATPAPEPEAINPEEKEDNKKFSKGKKRNRGRDKETELVDETPHMPENSIIITRSEIYDENMISLEKLGSIF